MHSSSRSMTQNLVENGDAMRRGRDRLQSLREPQQTWWIVYLQDVRRQQTGGKNIGSGARYALQTFMGTHDVVVRQFGSALARAFVGRREALDFLTEMNVIDAVMNS